jgi:gliding motility-associated lipoprotein GldJ
MGKPIMSFLKQVGVLLLCSFLLQSCFLFKKKEEFQTSQNITEKGQKSKITGVNYNDENNKDSFKVNEYEAQPEAPNMVYIEGGRFTFGSTEEDLLYTHDALEQTESIQSFYMDKTEIANIHWLEYMKYYENPSNADSIPNGMNLQDYLTQVLLPDTTVWASEMAFNDAYVANYLRYPGFRFYPVVGVSWIQANEFCKWRTMIVRQNMTKQKNGGGNNSTNSLGNKNFNSPVVDGQDILIPEYRLPTELEWEYAAKAVTGTQYTSDETYPKNRVYPWDGNALRNPYHKKEYTMGYMLANFKRGRGDYAGIAGKLNDGAFLTTHIFAYPPNDFGLYNMAGNVNEWVGKFPPLQILADSNSKNPFTRLVDSTKIDTTKKTTNNTIVKQNPLSQKQTSLIDDDSRVYKGGSWKDVAYWCSPGTRRFLNKESKRADLGFRCAMDALQNEKKKKSNKKR